MMMKYKISTFCGHALFEKICVIIEPTTITARKSANISFACANLRANMYSRGFLKIGLIHVFTTQMCNTKTMQLEMMRAFCTSESPLCACSIKNRIRKTSDTLPLNTSNERSRRSSLLDFCGECRQW